MSHEELSVLQRLARLEQQCEYFARQVGTPTPPTPPTLASTRKRERSRSRSRTPIRTPIRSRSRSPCRSPCRSPVVRRVAETYVDVNCPKVYNDIFRVHVKRIGISTLAELRSIFSAYGDIARIYMHNGFADIGYFEQDHLDACLDHATELERKYRFRVELWTPPQKRRN